MFPKGSSEQVLIGEVVGKGEINQPYESQLGGIPKFYHDNIMIPNCCTCGKPLHLITQIFAPTTYYRTLYVFGCNNSKCIVNPGRDELRDTLYNIEDNSTISQPLPPQPPIIPIIPPNPSKPAEADDWGIPTASGTTTTTTSLFDFSSPSVTSETTDSSQAISNLSSLLSNLKTKSETSTAASQNYNILIHPSSISSFNSPSVISNDYIFPSYLIDYYYEENQKSKSKSKYSSDTITVEKGEDNGEGYEKLPAYVKYFLKFEKIISSNPKQIIRYAYEGDVLWPIVPFQLNIPNCKCGKKRIFECEILPSSLNYLDTDKNLKIEIDPISHKKVIKNSGMDWSGILIFSCPDSCNESIEEYCVVLEAFQK